MGTESSNAGRLAALEAISDMLAVLDMPFVRFAALVEEIARTAPGQPGLSKVNRKVAAIAERTGAAAGQLSSLAEVQRLRQGITAVVVAGVPAVVAADLYRLLDGESAS